MVLLNGQEQWLAPTKKLLLQHTLQQLHYILVLLSPLLRPCFRSHQRENRTHHWLPHSTVLGSHTRVP
jgi:hypothetical protein